METKEEVLKYLILQGEYNFITKKHMVCSSNSCFPGQEQKCTTNIFKKNKQDPGTNIIKKRRLRRVIKIKEGNYRKHGTV